MTVIPTSDTTRCRVAEIEMVTDDIRILRIVATDMPLIDWRAGQYASFRIDGFEARDYSIANAPGEEFIELHIRRSGAGGFSDFVCEGLKVDDVIDVKGAYGGAYFRENHVGPVLAIAGGTGLAPMKAVVEAALSSNLKQDIHLYFGVRDESEIYLERYFIDLTRAHPNFRFVSVLSEPKENSGRRRGLVSQAVAADFQLLYGCQCYLGGPPQMVDACASMLKLKSVPKYDVFADAFYREEEMRAMGAPRPDWT